MSTSSVLPPTCEHEQRTTTDLSARAAYYHRPVSTSNVLSPTCQHEQRALAVVEQRVAVLEADGVDALTVQAQADNDTL